MTTQTKPRVGRKMAEIRDYVSCVPGCSRADALRAAGLQTSGMGTGRSLNRLIIAGLVIVERPRCNLLRLFSSERDRQRFHLRQALLQPGTPAERVAEIRADIERLDAERAATWTMEGAA